MNIASRFARSLVSLSLFALTVALAACGAHPGGSVGDACSNTGTNEGCAENEICDSVEGFGEDAYCLLVCDDQSDCEAGENCNGVSGASGKGCHPVAESDAEGEDDEDATGG